MLKQRLGILVLLLALGAAPGCRAVAAIGIVALDVAVGSAFDDDCCCHCGRRHCRHRR